MLQTLPSTSPKKPKARKRLNSKQIELLQILYKFRFATAELISLYQEQSKQYTNIRLEILCEQKYVGKNYDSSYKINRRPATYYLLLDAIKLLKKDPELDPKGLHLLYYNRRAKQAFINHHIRLMRLCLKFEKIYGHSLEIYSSTELAEQQQLPSPRPDFFFSFSGKHDNQKDSILYLLESTTSMDRHRHKLQLLLSHIEQTEGGSDEPRILLVCDNLGLQREVQRFVARMLENKNLIYTQCYITTVNVLAFSNSPHEKTWTDIQNIEKPVALWLT